MGGTQPAARLLIDLDAIIANWRHLSEIASPARCGAVVKADAYGLGATHVVRALLRAGCREFFVALVDEGVQLWDALKSEWPANARIHVLHGPLPGAEATCLSHGLTPVLNSLDQIERWTRLAAYHQRRLSAAIQVDTGMARLGLSPADLDRLQARPSRLDGITTTFLMTHLASAEEADNPMNVLQLERFNAARKRFSQALACLANSSGIFLGSAFHFDVVRPGAALYGVAPTVGQANPMRPVVRIKASLIQCRDVARGEGVGYNHTWSAPCPSRIATVSVGYADGYLRSASNRAKLRLNGEDVPVVGRVSMDTVTVDVSAINPEYLVPGALFDVIDDVQDINALALQAETNAYEILTSLGSRYRREYVGGQRIYP
ncbi:MULTISPECIES: alanine racemase [Ralstonia]|uniref:alanine racemase n=1 Tax=Ralstonia TaxID=48736 RepID=UPI002090DB90|nr:alanine racemase [Ralstonia mojiangensis]MCO5413522.1 alanine racemase [Ralstonia mojiangensis]